MKSDVVQALDIFSRPDFVIRSEKYGPIFRNYGYGRIFLKSGGTSPFLSRFIKKASFRVYGSVVGKRRYPLILFSLWRDKGDAKLSGFSSSVIYVKSGNTS